MIELERRALLGDRQAQEECTRRRIVLRCPFCGRKDILTLHLNSNIYHNYQSDCVLGGRFVPLSDWNTRPAPPVGRCGECEKSPDIGTKTKGMRWCRRFRAEVKPDGYCDGFRQKGGEENAAD